MTIPTTSQSATYAAVTNAQQQKCVQDSSTRKGVLLGLGIAFGLTVKPLLTLGACYIAYAASNQDHQNWLFNSGCNLAASAGRKVSAVVYEKGYALASASGSVASRTAYAAYEKGCSLLSSGGSVVYESASRTLSGLTGLARRVEHSPYMTGGSELATSTKAKDKID